MILAKAQGWKTHGFLDKNHIQPQTMGDPIFIMYKTSLASSLDKNSVSKPIASPIHCPYRTALIRACSSAPKTCEILRRDLKLTSSAKIIFTIHFFLIY